MMNEKWQITYRVIIVFIATSFVLFLGMLGGYFYAVKEVNEKIQPSNAENILARELLLILTDLRYNPNDRALINNAKDKLKLLYLDILNTAQNNFQISRIRHDYNFQLTNAINNFSDKLINNYIIKSRKDFNSNVHNNELYNDLKDLKLDYRKTAELFKKTASPLLANDIVSLFGRRFNVPVIGHILSYIIRPVSNEIITGLVHVGALMDHMTIFSKELKNITANVLKMVTIENYIELTESVTYRQEYLFGLFEGYSNVSFKFKAHIVAGFDLNKELRISINHKTRNFSLYLPEPEIISIGIIPTLENFEENWLGKVNSVQIQEALEKAQEDVKISIDRQHLLEKAKRSAKINLPKFIDGFVNNSFSNLNYHIKIYFVSDFNKMQNTLKTK